MPEFYQTHLRTCLSTAQFLLLMLVIQLLQTLKTIKPESLAANLPIPIQTESRRRKLKRFLSLPGLSFERVWHPIFLEQLQRTYAPGARVYVFSDNIVVRLVTTNLAAQIKIALQVSDNYLSSGNSIKERH